MHLALAHSSSAVSGVTPNLQTKQNSNTKEFPLNRKISGGTQKFFAPQIFLGVAKKILGVKIFLGVAKNFFGGPNFFSGVAKNFSEFQIFWQNFEKKNLGV